MLTVMPDAPGLAASSRRRGAKPCTKLSGMRPRFTFSAFRRKIFA